MTAENERRTGPTRRRGPESTSLASLESRAEKRLSAVGCQLSARMSGRIQHVSGRRPIADSRARPREHAGCDSFELRGRITRGWAFASGKCVDAQNSPPGFCAPVAKWRQACLTTAKLRFLLSTAWVRSDGAVHDR
jgi:hypothetical protein